MKILKITNEHRNDFSADMKCEHCGAIKHITDGYHDKTFELTGPPSAGPVGRRVRRVVDKGDDVDEPKNVTLRVTEQGAVRVNAAHIHREAAGIVCIYVDLHSKRVETPMVGGGDNEPPVLYFTAGEHALHLDESKPRDSMTIVEFPEYAGWHVFACDGPARYTLGVVLVAPEASA